MKQFLALFAVVAVAACSTTGPETETISVGQPTETAPDQPQISPVPPPPTVTAGQSLGLTVATLGDASQSGSWLKTPLVSSEQQGILISVQTGRRTQATLMPIPGEPTSGSRISLQAMQALGLPLTALAQIDVRAGQ